MVKKQYAAVDIAKYVSALLVVCIHTFPFIDINEMLNTLFVLFDIALVVDIKLLRHFLTLAIIIHHKHTIAHHQTTTKVILADGVDIIFQHIQLLQIRIGDKIQVAVNADFVRLQPVELILNHRVHMVEGVAGTIPFIEGERPLAVVLHVHIRIVGFAFAEHGFGFFVKDDIGELFVLVRPGIQGFLHQFPVDIRSVLFFVVPAVDPVHLRAGAAFPHDPLFKSGRRVAVSAGLRFFGGLKFRQAEIHADADELLLGDQDIRQGIIEEFADDLGGVFRNDHEIVHALH